MTAKKMMPKRSFTYDETTFDVTPFIYNAETGAITKHGKRAERAEASGYLRVCRNQNHIMAHRLAWRLHYGEWPAGLVDHWDTCKANNRISNLRIATNSQNNFNKGIQRNNTIGERGVTAAFYGASKLFRYRFQVGCNGVRMQQYASSYFSAVCAARLIRRILHGQFAYENRSATPQN